MLLITSLVMNNVFDDFFGYENQGYYVKSTEKPLANGRL